LSEPPKATVAPNGSSEHGKENLLRVGIFDTVEALQAVLQTFQDDDNARWPIPAPRPPIPNRFRREIIDKITAAT